MICAAFNGYLGVVEYLVERGADMETTDNNVSNCHIVDVKPHIRKHTFVKFSV